MNIEKERKAFEERLKHLDLDYVDDLGYCESETQTAWESWIESANREGYKLVPIKCTNNMAHAAKEIDGRLSAFKYGDVWEAMIGACDE